MGPFFIYTGIILLLPLLVSSPKTTVILLDNNESTNGVVVSTQGGTTELDTPYTSTTLTKAEEKPQASSTLSESEVQGRYKDLLDSLPPKPARLQFYFEEGTSNLTPESQMQTGQLVELVQSREPCIVDIVGHTDTEGQAKANYELGLKRAEMLKAFLEQQQVKIKEFTVQSYGENDLLIPTADGVAEPRNRRVEVIVR